jgi:hypothetical protein
MGAPLEVNAVEAIIWCIKITAGEVKWLSDRMAELEEEDWFEHSSIGEQLSIYARERIRATERLHKFSRDAIALGIAERAVRLAETYGESIAMLLRNVLQDLKLNKTQQAQAPSIIRKHLLLMESGKPDLQEVYYPPPEQQAPAVIEARTTDNGNPR